jgi:type IV secretion system protein VirB5
MKKFYSVVLIFIGFLLSITSQAQLAVIDITAISTAASNQAANIAKFTAQVDLLVNQLTQLQEEYKSITGSRGFGDFLKKESFQDNLPTDWQAVYDQVRTKGYAGLSPAAKQIYDKNKIYDSCQHWVVADEKQLCEARAVKTAQDQAFALDALEKSDDRLVNIRKLSDEIKNTKDPKGIAELEARITAEQNAIANDQAKWEQFKMAQAAEDRLQQQRLHEVSMREASKTGTLNIQPMDFTLGD